MKKLILIALILVGCSKADDPTPKKALADQLVGKKFRRLSWSIGDKSSWSYSVLEFKTNNTVRIDTRNEANQYNNIGPQRDVEWKKVSGTEITIKYFPNIAEYKATVTKDEIIISGDTYTIY